MKLLMRLEKIHPAVFLLVAVAWRLLLVFVFSTQITTTYPDKAVASGFGFIANDYHYFIDPAERLYTHGEYAVEEGVPFAGRMPGYGTFYLLFRVWMSQEAANLMMIISQAVFGGVGAYFLARAAEMYYRRRIAFLIVFAVGLLYPVSAFFDYQTLAEGVAINFMCIAFYMIMRGLQHKPVKWFLLAGFFIGWTVFLRPYLGIMLPLFGLFILWKSNEVFIRRLWHVVIFGLPFTIALLAWNIRNYQVMDNVVIMETSTAQSYGKTYSLAWLQIRNLIYFWGGETGYFEPGSDAEWFRKDSSDKPLNLPQRVYDAGCFTAEDLQKLKVDFQAFHYGPGFDTTLHDQVARTALEYRKCYVSQQSNIERAMISANVVKKSTLRSGSSYMPLVNPVWLDKIFRLLFLGMYYLLLIGWMVAAVMIPRSRIWILPAVALFIGIFQVSSVVEHRYFLTMMPFVIMGFTAITLKALEKLRG